MRRTRLTSDHALLRLVECYSARCTRSCQEVCGPCWDIGGCGVHDRYREDHCGRPVSAAAPEERQ